MRKKNIYIIFIMGAFLLNIAIFLKVNLQTIHFREQRVIQDDYLDRPVDLYVEDDLLYVIDSKGLNIFEKNIRGDRYLIGNLSFLDSNLTAIHAHYPYAYVLDKSQGLYILNVSNPFSPSIISNFYNGGEAMDLAIYEDYIYLADGSQGVEILNISDPHSPELKGSFDDNPNIESIFSGGYSYDIEIKEVGEKLFCFVADWADGLEILDVTSCADITEIGQFHAQVGQNTTLKVRGIETYGGLAFLAADSNGIKVLNISNFHNHPENLDVLLQIPRVNGKAWSCEVNPNHLSANLGIDGVKIYTITDQYTLNLKGTFSNNLMSNIDNSEEEENPTFKKSFLDEENEELYLISNHYLYSVSISMTKGDLVFLILIPFSIIFFSTAVHYYKEYKKLLRKYSKVIHSNSLYGFSINEIDKFLRDTKQIRENFKLTSVADSYIDRYYINQLYLQNISSEDDNQTDQINFEENITSILQDLKDYYEESAFELANRLIKEKTLQEGLKQRLLLEGDHQIRKLLEHNLPSSHPILEEFNKKFWIEVGSGYSIIK